MFYVIKKFFKELFKSDIGKYNPEADKLHFKQVLYWIIGLIICFLIPMCLVYLEVGQFDWNVFKFIWGDEVHAYRGNALYRGGFLISSLCANVSFLTWGFLSTYIINGRKDMLNLKQWARFFFVISIISSIICYIWANIY